MKVGGLNLINCSFIMLRLAVDVALSTVPTLIADSEETRDSEDEPAHQGPARVNDDDRQKLTQRWALPVPGSIGRRRVHSRGGAGEAGPKWTRQTLSGPLHSALPVATESLHSPPASPPCPAGRLAVGLALGADSTQRAPSPASDALH